MRNRAVAGIWDLPAILLTPTGEIRRNYYGDEALARLRRLGEVRINETERPLDTEGLIRLAEGCDIVVADRQTAGPAGLFEALPDLAAFVRIAVDIRNIDVPAASRAGVLVTQASAGFMAAVSELVLGTMIALARDVVSSAVALRGGTAPVIRMGRQLDGSTIGIIGFGAIGRHLAGLAQALGMRVLVADPFAAEMPDRVERVDLADLLAAADFVVCLAPATDATENLMNAERFAMMKRGAFFLNPSRGGLVEDAALIAALDSGHLAGAAVDVGRAPNEMPAPELARHPRIIATPHVGGLTPDATRHQALETVRQCAAILRGEAPPGALNAAEATRFRAFSGAAPAAGTADG